MKLGLWQAPIWLSAIVALSAREGGAEPERRAQAKAEASGTLISLSVRVVDASADRAYIEPGAARGLRIGDEVRFDRANFKVTATTQSSAVLALGKQRVAIGARGNATIAADRPERVVLALPKPAPLANFRGDWPRSRVPAAEQQPEAVPLKARDHSPARLLVQDALYGAVPLHGPGKFIGNELRGRLHYEPQSLRPLAFDLDLGVQTFAGDGFSRRPGAAARQLLRVRELSVAYGRAGDFRGTLGRMRAASSALGQLDGLRLDAPLGGNVRLSAFGGSSPEVFSGMFSTELLRFGSELVYEGVESPLRPRVVVGALFSRFDGALDERKTYAAADLMPGPSRVGGHAELSFFDARNAFNARPVELSAAGLDADFEVDRFHFGGRVDMRRPDRSRYLLSLLPLEWLCWSDPALARAPCSSENAYYTWLLDAGARLGKFSVDLGGQSAYTTGTDASNFGAFANLRFLDLIGRAHLDLGMTAFTGSLERVVAAMLTPGIVFADGNADLSIRLRAAGVRHRADLGSSFEPAIGAGLWMSPHESVDFDVEGDWIRERELTAFVMQAIVSWRLGR